MIKVQRLEEENLVSTLVSIFEFFLGTISIYIYISCHPWPRNLKRIYKPLKQQKHLEIDVLTVPTVSIFLSCLRYKFKRLKRKPEEKQTRGRNVQQTKNTNACQVKHQVAVRTRRLGLGDAACQSLYLQYGSTIRGLDFVEGLEIFDSLLP